MDKISSVRGRWRKSFACGKKSMDRGKFGKTLRKTVWQKHWGLNILSLTPQVKFFLPFTDKLLQRSIYLHCFFPLSSHPLQPIFQTVYCTLAEATNFHVGKSKEHSSVLILFSFSAISGGQSFFLRTISFLGFCDIPHLFFFFLDFFFNVFCWISLFFYSLKE